VRNNARRAENDRQDRVCRRSGPEKDNEKIETMKDRSDGETRREVRFADALTAWGFQSISVVSMIEPVRQQAIPWLVLRAWKRSVDDQDQTQCCEDDELRQVIMRMDSLLEVSGTRAGFYRSSGHSNAQTATPKMSPEDSYEPT
jgi:hypothetical protein